VGPRSGLDTVVKRKIPNPRRESNSVFTSKPPDFNVLSMFYGIHVFAQQMPAANMANIHSDSQLSTLVWQAGHRGNLNQK
jgi:hypothetical protein